MRCLVVGVKRWTEEMGQTLFKFYFTTATIPVEAISVRRLVREWKLSVVTHRHGHRAPGQGRRAQHLQSATGDGGCTITTMLSKPYRPIHSMECALGVHFAVLGLVDRLDSGKNSLQAVLR